MKKQKYKVGDEVQITKGPPDKLGKIGKITVVTENGAIIKLSKYHHTIVKKIHFKKVK